MQQKKQKQKNGLLAITIYRTKLLH